MEAARSVLKTVFGFDDFRIGQVDIVTAVLQGKDVLGVLPTGGGKSLCFQVPALVFPGCTLVVSPLIALMTDQVQRLRQRNVEAECLHSGQSNAEQQQIFDKARQGLVKLLYVAPERLSSSQFVQQLAGVTVSLLAVDEAHCISEYGHDFRPAYRLIPRLFSVKARVPIVALTATATPDVRTDVTATLQMINPTVIVRGFDRPNLSLKVYETAHKVEAIAAIAIKHSTESILIYAGSRRTTETLAAELGKRGISAAAYHAGKHPTERQTIQESFLNGTVPVLTATNAFGMGIDKPDIRFVIHADLTLTPEAYYQEAGRAGRDGKPAVCLLLYHESDRRLMDFFIECTYPDEQTISKVLNYLHYQNSQLRPGELLRADETQVAVTLHLSHAHVKGVMNLLEREGALVRTSADGYVQVVRRASADRLQEFAQAAPATTREAARAISSLLMGADARDGVTISIRTILQRNGISVHEFRETLKAMLLARLISYKGRESDAGVILLTSSDSQIGDIVDMPQVHQRTDRAIGKLNLVINYAQTAECKRNYLLNYFGDVTHSSRCGRCSSCTETKQVPSISSRDKGTERAVVQCVYELRNRFGRNVVADVLTGTASAKVIQHNLHHAASWGALKSYNRSEVMRVIDGSVVRQMLVLTGSLFPLLGVSEKGLRAYRPMPRQLELRAPVVDEMFAAAVKALLEFRDSTADRENKAPSSLCSMAAIERLASDMPKSVKELVPPVHGDGIFLAHYSDEILQVLNKVRMQQAGRIPSARITETTRRVVALAETSTSLAHLAERLRLTAPQVAQQLQLAIEGGVSVNLSTLIPAEVFEQVVRFVRNHRYARLRQVREYFGNEVDYPVLRVAVAAARRELYGVPQ